MHGVMCILLLYPYPVQIIIVGDEEGNINVYQLKKMNAAPEDQVGVITSHVLKVKDKITTQSLCFQ